MEKNSLRFTKYNAIENGYNKNNELILWEYNNNAIFISNKKTPFLVNIPYGQVIN